MHVEVHPEVDAAVRNGRPVVALESAVITCGLPAQTLDELGVDPAVADGVASAGPANLVAARLMEAAIRAGGAVPATIAVLDGRLHVGVDEPQLERLAATAPDGPKAASRDLAALIAAGAAAAGTTVSATLLACTLTERPLRVMATGGIGGVHRDWTRRPDVSADLGQLARTPACVVCAGAKSILDLPATLEVLESLAIPVLGYRTDRFACFYSNGTVAGTARPVESADAIAALCRAHWASLGCGGGVLVARPVPADHAIEPDVIESAVEQTTADALTGRVQGAALTPFLLRGLARRTAGRTIAANLALLAANASLAAEVAGAMAR